MRAIFAAILAVASSTPTPTVETGLFEVSKKTEDDITWSIDGA